MTGKVVVIQGLVKRFDVVAIQEAQKSLGALRELLLGLGRNWTVISALLLLIPPPVGEMWHVVQRVYCFDRNRGSASDGRALHRTAATTTATTHIDLIGCSRI